MVDNQLSHPVRVKETYPHRAFHHHGLRLKLPYMNREKTLKQPKITAADLNANGLTKDVYCSFYLTDQ